MIRLERLECACAASWLVLPLYVVRFGVVFGTETRPTPTRGVVWYKDLDCSQISLLLWMGASMSAIDSDAKTTVGTTTNQPHAVVFTHLRTQKVEVAAGPLARHHSCRRLIQRKTFTIQKAEVPANEQT